MRDRTQKALLVLASIVLCFGVLEIGVRVWYGNPPPFLYPQARHMPTDYGYKLEPNQKDTYTMDRPVRTNSFGFRDSEWAMPKSSSAWRIMVVGDSQTFPNGVDIESSYPKVLAREINNHRMDVEVIVAAAGGWSISNEVEFLKSEGLSYQPDVLILGFFPNDYQIKHDDTSERLKRNGLKNLSADGRWDGRPRWLQWLPYRMIFLIKRSALIRQLRDRIGLLTYEGGDLVTQLLQNQVVLAEAKRIQDTYAFLDEIVELCEARGIELVVAMIPPINLFWFENRTFLYIQDMRRYCEGNTIGFVDLSQQVPSDTNSMYLYPWDNHLSPLGHEAMAKQLYTYLLARGETLLPGVHSGR